MYNTLSFILALYITTVMIMFVYHQECTVTHGASTTTGLLTRERIKSEHAQYTQLFCYVVELSLFWVKETGNHTSGILCCLPHHTTRANTTVCLEEALTNVQSRKSNTTLHLQVFYKLYSWATRDIQKVSAVLSTPFIPKQLTSLIYIVTFLCDEDARQN